MHLGSRNANQGCTRTSIGIPFLAQAPWIVGKWRVCRNCRKLMYHSPNQTCPIYFSQKGLRQTCPIYVLQKGLGQTCPIRCSKKKIETDLGDS